jgi:hypothetical protein
MWSAWLSPKSIPVSGDNVTYTIAMYPVVVITLCLGIMGASISRSNVI